MKCFHVGLLGRVVIAICCGVLLGGFVPVWVVRLFVTFDDFFGEFLNFIIPFIVLGLVAPAIADMGRMAGRMLVLTVGIAYVATLLSGFLSYFTGIVFFPRLIPSSVSTDIAEGGAGALPFFSIDIPPVFGVLPALVLAFVMGLGIAFTRVSFLRGIFSDLKVVMAWVIRLVIIPMLPLYIFGIFLNMSFSGQVYGILSVFVKIIGVIFGLHVFVLLLQYVVAGWFTGRNPFVLLYRMLPAYFTALGTQSSAATIPVTLERTRVNGVGEGVADFVIPLCATIHLSGSMLKIVACALALMMMQGMSYDFGLFAGFVFMLGVMMIAAPGVPGGAIMASLGVLSSVLGFDDSLQAMMVALYIAMDSFGTACNVTGDGAIALIVDRIMGEKGLSRS